MKFLIKIDGKILTFRRQDDRIVIDHGDYVEPASPLEWRLAYLFREEHDKAIQETLDELQKYGCQQYYIDIIKGLKYDESH